MRRKGRPARYIGEPVSSEIQKLEALKFEKQKSMITPQPYDFTRIENYLETHYDLEEKTLWPIEIEMFKLILQHQDYYDSTHFSPLFLTVVRNEKSSVLYEGHPDDEKIFLHIEKNSGFIETDSCELYNKLTVIRGITQEEYDRNSQKLYQLIGVMFHPDADH